MIKVLMDIRGIQKLSDFNYDDFLRVLLTLTSAAQVSFIVEASIITPLALSKIIENHSVDYYKQDISQPQAVRDYLYELYITQLKPDLLIICNHDFTDFSINKYYSFSALILLPLLSSINSNCRRVSQISQLAYGVYPLNESEEINGILSKAGNKIINESFSYQLKPRLFLVAPTSRLFDPEDLLFVTLLNDFSIHYQLNIVTSTVVKNTFFNQITETEFLEKESNSNIVYILDDNAAYYPILKLFFLKPGTVILRNIVLVKLFSEFFSHSDNILSMSYAEYMILNYGYSVLLEKHNPEEFGKKYPLCFELIKNANGVIISPDHFKLLHAVEILGFDERNVAIYDGKETYSGLIYSLQNNCSSQRLIYQVDKMIEFISPQGSENLDYQKLISTLQFNVTPGASNNNLIYYDVSCVAQEEFNTGIQRVVKVILLCMLKIFPKCQLLPVYFKHGKCYIAHRFITKLTGFSQDKLLMEDQIIEFFQPKATFLGVDFHFAFSKNKSLLNWLLDQQMNGVRLYSVCYDLIPVQNPEFFVSWFNINFLTDLKVKAQHFDGIICNSKYVADSYATWHQQQNFKRDNPIQIKYFPLGADGYKYNSHYKDKDTNFFEQIKSKEYVLMVSTIEPRKGHAQILEVFEALWNDGYQQTLVLVGSGGWMVKSLIKRIKSHPLYGRKLFWFSGVSDSDLGNIYKSASGFIMASYNEGFGLGIVESAKYNVPLMLRDIPVFREVADNNAVFFSGSQEEIIIQFKYWLDSLKNRPYVMDSKTYSWEDSTRFLMEILQA